MVYQKRSQFKEKQKLLSTKKSEDRSFEKYIEPLVYQQV